MKILKFPLLFFFLLTLSCSGDTPLAPDVELELARWEHPNLIILPQPEPRSVAYSRTFKAFLNGNVWYALPDDKVILIPVEKLGHIDAYSRSLFIQPKGEGVGVDYLERLAEVLKASLRDYGVLEIPPHELFVK